MIARIDKEDDNDAGPTPNEKRVLRKYFGHPAHTELCLFHHQFGGIPVFHCWADEVFFCTNPKCEVDRNGKKRAMKFVAGILNDPWGGLPMIEPAKKETKKNWDFFVSVQFHICDRCFTVFGCNRGT